MNDKEKLNYVCKEIEAIYQDFDTTVDQLILERKFLKELLKISQDKIPAYELNKIIKLERCP